MSDKRNHSFRRLNATQFLGALNDNIYKLLIVFFLIHIMGKENAALISARAGAVFVLPFLLFSHAGGVLADRYSKKNIIVFTKILEVFVMTLGGVAFLSGSPFLAYTTLFFMATQSAIFGPSKYGVIPELVGRERLSRANGIITAFTYLAIIFGTPIAGLLSWVFSSNYVWAALFCIFIAASGTACSLKISKTEASGAKSKFTPAFLWEIGKTVFRLRKDGYLLLAVLGSAYFLLIWAYIQMNIIPYGINHLGMTGEQSSQFFLLAALGIGAGSFLVGRLSGRNIEFGTVPLGALGITAGSLLMGIFNESRIFCAFLVFVMGMSGGMFIVPLDAFVQFRSPRKRLGSILAAKSFLGFSGVLVASGLMYFMSNVMGLTAAQGFFGVGVMTFILTMITLKILPDFLIRFIAFVIMRLGYRMEIKGRENVPLEGGALLICNHVSWVDALLLMATQQRRIRFVMYRDIYESRWLNPLFRLMKNFPVSPEDSPRTLVKTFNEVRAALDEGYLVCIFAEGSITRTGNLATFRRGFEQVMKGRDNPIIPVFLGGAWGSILSYYHGKLASRIPSLLPYRIKVIFGKPMPSDSRSVEVRQAVMDLASHSFEMEKPRRRSLGTEFVRTARKNWFRLCMNDTDRKSVV